MITSLFDMVGYYAQMVDSLLQAHKAHPRCIGRNYHLYNNVMESDYIISHKEDSMQKWEYIKLILAWSWEGDGATQSQTDRLRQMGLDGWELVTVLSFTGTSG